MNDKNARTGIERGRGEEEEERGLTWDVEVDEALLEDQQQSDHEAPQKDPDSKHLKQRPTKSQKRRMTA